ARCSPTDTLASTNDTDRVRKYLARFDLDFASLGT
ncbi:MAG: sigma54-dependent transcription regulator, partial [Planctomycetota bacterium]